jgi:short-subunit dehydrogenase
MLARGEKLLRETADEVRARHGVEVRPVVGDLADPDVGQVIADATSDLDMGLFVYNATIAMQGRFLDVPIEDQLASVTVNCATPLVLCKLFGTKMVARGRGGIGIINSLGGTQGSINFSTYNAGKAFQWVLAETLWAELADQGVDVTTLFVGATASPNYLAFMETLDPALAGQRDSDDPLERARARLMDPRTPDEVAVALYDQLSSGPVCYSDPNDAWIARQTFLLPREEAIGLWRGVQETATRPSSRVAR